MGCRYCGESENKLSQIFAQYYSSHNHILVVLNNKL